MATEFQQHKLIAYLRASTLMVMARWSGKTMSRSASVAEGRGYPPGSQEYEAVHSMAMRAWEMIQHLDADDDGKVTFDEAIRGYEQASDTIQDIILSWVDLLDADGDGRISAEEYVQGLTGFLDPATASEMFAGMDADGDGYLSREELRRLSDEWIRSDDPTVPGNMLLGPY